MPAAERVRICTYMHTRKRMQSLCWAGWGGGAPSRKKCGRQKKGGSNGERSRGKLRGTSGWGGRRLLNILSVSVICAHRWVCCMVCVCVCVCARALASMRAAAWKYVVSLNHGSKGCRHARRHASASLRVCRHSCARACIHTFMHPQRHATMQAVRSLLQPRHTHSRAAGRSEGRAHAGLAQRCTSVRK